MDVWVTVIGQLVLSSALVAWALRQNRRDRSEGTEGAGAPGGAAGAEGARDPSRPGDPGPFAGPGRSGRPDEG